MTAHDIVNILTFIGQLGLPILLIVGIIVYYGEFKKLKDTIKDKESFMADTIKDKESFMAQIIKNNELFITQYNIDNKIIRQFMSNYFNTNREVVANNLYEMVKQQKIEMKDLQTWIKRGDIDKELAIMINNIHYQSQIKNDINGGQKNE